jgi:hypothetical protein
MVSRVKFKKMDEGWGRRLLPKRNEMMFISLLFKEKRSALKRAQKNCILG